MPCPLPQEFISAGKPKEACDMYMHNQDWDAAMRIAERYDPTMVSDILVAQARVAAERKQWLPAEVRALQSSRTAHSHASRSVSAKGQRPARVHVAWVETSSAPLARSAFDVLHVVPVGSDSVPPVDVLYTPDGFAPA